MTTPEAARLKDTANSTPASIPSLARASAAESSAGPSTVAVTVFESFLPPCVHTAPGAAQSVVAGSVTSTSSNEAGCTVIVQRRFSPFATRFAFVTRPLVTASAGPLSARKLSFTSSLKVSPKLNALSPSCSPGTPWNDAVSAGSAAGASRQSTLCAGSWPRPAWARSAFAPAADRIAPPFAASVFASTAIPVGEVFGSTTVWTKVRLRVPEPLS